MPYREYPRIPQHVRKSEPDAPLREFDVSGRKGNDGRHGLPGADGMGAGAHGQRGGNAGPAEPGESAGWIKLELATAEVDGMARLGGTVLGAGGEMSNIDEIITFGEHGFIELNAVGGDGGKGGDGGEGGNGARGRRGRDATRHSSGGNGGPGGNGGDGGNATSGGPGGDGGDITLVVDDTDTQLLMLVTQRTSGGHGGLPGHNGTGGAGGAGGAGGSSYSWTETETYTDSQGNTRTRTTHHSNSGGWSGPSGSAGAPGMAPVHRGQKGRDGSFAIEVKSARGVTTYESRYDLRLLSFAHESANQDCVYEPQETVRVCNIEVANVGGMPTPAHRDIELTLVRRGWVAPHDEHLLLPRALGPGERCTVDGALHFVIGDWKPHGPDDPLERDEVIGHRARLPSVYRDFVDYEHQASREQGQFVIRFPVRSEPIRSLYSLAPGQAARMRWSIVNQSLAALGAASECGRVVRVRLGLHDSELGDEHLACVDDSGASFSLGQEFVREIDLIEAGGRRDFEIVLGIEESAPHYRSVDVWLSLELGYLDTPAQARPVQYRAFSTRVSRPYRPDPDADLLLVVNHRTTRQALDAWDALARSLGFAYNVWDLSFERSLDLQADVRGHGSLIAQLRGKTIVICDNAMDSATGATYPHCFLGKEDMFAAAAAGIDIALLGTGIADMRAHLIPTHHDNDADRPGTGASASELLTALALIRTDRATGLERVEQTVEVTTRLRLWGRPDLTYLSARARRLQRRLRDQHPDRRYIVVYDFRPEVVSRFLWMKRWRAGTLLVRGTLDTAAGTLVHEQMNDEDIHDPARIASPSTIMTLLLTRDLDEKLARLATLVRARDLPALPWPDSDDDGDGNRDEDSNDDTGQPGILDLVVDAICADLANEQHAIMTTGWRSGLAARELPRCLPQLRRLAQVRFGEDNVIVLDSPRGVALIRMIARLMFLFSSQARWWEWPLYWWRRGPLLCRVSKRWLARFAEHVFDAPALDAPLRRARSNQVRRRIKAEVKNLRRGHKSARRLNPQVRNAGEYSRALLRAPLERQGVTTDAELLTSLQSRLLSRDEYDDLAARDQAAEAERAQLMHDATQARADLLVTR